MAAALPGRAAAHAGDAAPELASAWTYDPILLLPLLAGILVYAIGLVLYWRRAGSGRGIRVAEAAAFLAGMLALSVALVWPLDVLGEWSLAMHMAQHMLLIGVAAPLVVLGRPCLVSLRALPTAWRGRVTWPLKTLKRRKTFAVFAGTTAATLVQAGMIWGWHAPPAMQLALTNDLAHYAMHATFLAAGCFFWWAMLRSLRDNAAGFGGGAIALVGTMVQMGLLSALLTFSQFPRYPWYFERSEALGLTPLEDQQLAGLIMWVPGAVPYLIGALWLMAAWLRRSERSDARRWRASARLPAMDRRWPLDPRVNAISAGNQTTRGPAARALLYNAESRITVEPRMAKERRPNKETKKKPAMTPKERKAAKKSKKEGTRSLTG